MDLRTKKKLDTVTVFDLMNNKFYIPDYQRGYRWTNLEVSKLLCDLEDYFNHNTDGSTFYCLQPLVVFFNKKEEAWEVIDGQQRLTTLFLILNQQRTLLEQIYPGMQLFELSYQSRPGSKTYLEQIDASQKNDNIDYYHMYNASQTIRAFLDKEASLGAWRFVDAVVNANNTINRPSVKFIWYDVTEDIESQNISSEEKFADLNIGKIGLTNAELIKALFLNNVADDESEALRIASDWDNIEHALQDDSFWSFIYGKDDGKYATRIEFLFDIIQQKAFNEQNEYYTFDAYSDRIKSLAKDAVQKNPHIISPEKNIIKALWKDVSDKYYLFKGWYENKNLYHIIGYLRYQKFDISEIEKIYDCPEIENVEQFYEKLLEKVLKCVDDTEIRNLNYHDSKDHKKIYDILTLFNVLSIIDCEKEDVRFSFDEFYKHSWDIEHVRSQTPKNLDGEGRQDWIICNLEYFSGVKQQDDFAAYKSAIDNAPNRNYEIVPGYTIGSICDELLKLYTDKSDITESSIYDILYKQVFKQDASFRYEDNIGNLVLLDQGTNRGYKNAFYPVKRKWIYRREHEGVYILPCTKNVFAKNYSDIIFDLMNWNNEDAEAYMSEIERVIYNGKTQL